MRVGYSTPRNPEVEALSEKSLTAENYRGHASVEFKRDDRDGLLKLIEISCRIPCSGMLAIASGVNIPWIIFQDILRENQIYIAEYKIPPDMLNNIFNPYKEKRGCFREYLNPYFTKYHTFAVFDWSDLRPFLRQVQNRF